jgi:choice-of-anchor B domain-containing protein
VFAPWLALVLVLAVALAGAPGAEAANASYNMTLLQNIDVYSGVNDCWGYASGGTEIAIYGHSMGTSFLDATDPQNAVELLNVPGPSSIWRDIKTYQNYAYIVTEGSAAGFGIQIVDLSDPLNPVHVNTYTGSGYQTAHNIWIDTGAGIAYACGAAGGGMHVLSLADPENPVQLSYFNPYYIHDLWVANGLGYAGAISSGSLRVLDTSSPASLSTIASKFYSGAATHNAWPNASGTHCLTSDETSGGHLRIWDVTSLPTITQDSEYSASNEPSAIIHNVLVEDDLAYCAYYLAGTRVVDVTDPTDPVEVGYYDTHPNAGGSFDGQWGVYPFRADDVIYASDRQTGFHILRFDGDYAGAVSGVVRDAGTLAPLAGATVTLAGAPAPFATDGAGSYGGRISGATYTVITSLFGYEADTASVLVPPQGSVVHDVNLVKLPVGDVELHLVRAGTSTPLPGAVVDIAGTPAAGVTDGAGTVTLTGLPAGLTWTIRAARFGSAVSSVDVVPVAGNTLSVDVEVPPSFLDDFELDQGWLVGAGDDGATGGIWERAVPIGSSFLGPVGADQDASLTGLGYAYVTENHVGGAFVGTSDVDGGKTTLSTPVFAADGLGSLTLKYQRWFSNRAPAPADGDEFRVDVSTDGGASWTNLETVTIGTDAWAAVSMDLTALVPATATMQLRFVAEDLGGDHYVEGGVDDLEILSSATDAVAVGGSEKVGLELSAPAPNPFRDSATLSFRIPSAGRVTLEVFDVAGRRVARLLEGERLAPGSHHVRWSGESEAGHRVAPGAYFARLSTEEGTVSRKLVRLR